MVFTFGDGVTPLCSQGFAQDVLHRIEEESGAYGSKEYSYDAAGNRLSRIHTSGGITTQTLTYDMDSNRLATHDAQPVTLDPAGNTTADAAANLSFTYCQPPPFALMNGLLAPLAHRTRRHSD